MISFTVGTTFLTHWLLGGRGNERDTALRLALQSLQGEEYLSVDGEDKLRSHCVYEVIDAFFKKLRPILTKQLKGDLTSLKDELQRTGREVYSHPSFTATEEHAIGWLAVHLLHPHGQIPAHGSSKTTDVFLPEFANRVELFCYFSGFGLEPRNIDEPAFQDQRDHLRAHLCDSLYAVYRRVHVAAGELQAGYAKTGRKDQRRFLPASDEDQLVILDAHVGGFLAYRSLRRDFPSIPPIGGHRLLVASAIRQGLGMPLVSETFPYDCWSPLPDPVKHFVLTAAEAVGKSRYEPVYPNVPFEAELEALNSEVTAGFVNNMRPEDSRHVPTLKMLGLGDVLYKRKAEYSARRGAGNYAGDWNDVAEELLTAIYGDNIERSLHLQDVLDLYPLHKRVLGLIEYVIIPKLQSGQSGGGASAVWTQAFTSNPPQGSNIGNLRDLATLETEGNWVLQAAEYGRRGDMKFESLLDAIAARLRSAPGVQGVSISLKPSPQQHARQLATLADNKGAYCLTLYLGKLALLFRNAIEHGKDEVVGKGLLLKTDYWRQKRNYGGVPVPIIDWNLNAAKKVSWHSERKLAKVGAAVPVSAKSFLLTPTSLHRCLVLVSLILHGASAHLAI